MGLLDKILDGIKDEIKSGLSQILSEADEDSQPAADSAPAEDADSSADGGDDYASVFTNDFDTGDDYFAALVTEDKFPGYTIERSVHASVFDASAHPKCYPISFLFRKDDRPVLAVFVMNSNQRSAMIAVGSYRILDAERIPYIRFYKGMQNKEDYVINRIRENLV